jgi:hypothetical protein
MKHFIFAVIATVFCMNVNAEALTLEKATTRYGYERDDVDTWR